jgi:gluconokinase
VNKGLYVVMGVAGSGKTLIGAALAHTLDVEFVDGDDFHSAENVAKMTAGIPLTDADRVEWLRTLALRLRTAKQANKGVVIACSALKRSYRDIFRAESPDVRFVFLKGSRDLFAERLARRSRHFMPASLLDSQLATLEEPAADEDAWVVDTMKSPADIVKDLATRASQ